MSDPNNRSEPDRREKMIEMRAGDGYSGKHIKHIINRMGRRGFLKKMASLGIGASAFHGLSHNAAAKEISDPTDTVPFVARREVKNPDDLRDGGPDDSTEMTSIVRRVPQDRWVRMKAAHNASSKLSNSIQNEFDDTTISVGVTTSGSERQLLVSRDLPLGRGTPNSVTDSETIKEYLPNKVTGTVGDGEYKVGGIEVKFTTQKYKNCSVYDSSYDPIPGGCRVVGVEEYDWEDGPEEGTLAQPVYNKNTEKYEMLTAGHVCHDPHNGMYQPKESAGTANWMDWASNYVYDTDNDELIRDAGSIALEGDKSMTYALADSGGGTQETISGYITWNTIQAEEDDYTYELTNQGITSGRTGGRSIIYTNSDTMYMKVEKTANLGDSGGPIFKEDGDQAYIAGVSAQIWDTNDDGLTDALGGNAVEGIYELLQLSFI